MKKLFAILAVMGALAFGTVQSVNAQDEAAAAAAPAATEQVDQTPAPAAEAATEADVVTAEENVGIHKELKTKYIEGSAFFMSFIAAAFVIGLAFCIERIIYLSLAEINAAKFKKQIEALLKAGKLNEAKELAKNTRGPIASIYFEGLDRIDQNLDEIEKAVVSYGGVQAGYLEKNCSWITLFIAMSPSLGFLGTVVGMVRCRRYESGLDYYHLRFDRCIGSPVVLQLHPFQDRSFDKRHGRLFRRLARYGH